MVESGGDSSVTSSTRFAWILFGSIARSSTANSSNSIVPEPSASTRFVRSSKSSADWSSERSARTWRTCEYASGRSVSWREKSRHSRHRSRLCSLVRNNARQTNCTAAGEYPKLRIRSPSRATRWRWKEWRRCTLPSPPRMSESCTLELSLRRSGAPPSTGTNSRSSASNSRSVTESGSTKPICLRSSSKAWAPTFRVSRPIA